MPALGQKAALIPTVRPRYGLGGQPRCEKFLTRTQEHMVRRYGNLAWTRTQARAQTGFKVIQRWLCGMRVRGEGAGTSLSHIWTLMSTEHSGHTVFSQVKNCCGAQLCGGSSHRHTQHKTLLEPSRSHWAFFASVPSALKTHLPSMTLQVMRDTCE